MAGYTSAQDIINNVLFRAGEAAGSSDWDSMTLDYLNRNYELLCAGATEFLSEDVEDWWWLRDKGVLTILPTYKTDTVVVTNNSATIAFNSAPAIDLTGYRFKVETHPDIFIIATHSAGNANATLDSIFTGPTSAAASFMAMKTTYSLSASVSAILSPISSFRNNPQIEGMQPERMDTLYPVQYLQPGVPLAFALDNEQTIRFSHGGLDDGTSMRMEYRFRPIVTPLTNNISSIPLVPIQYRPILAEMTLVQVYSDKNDDRINIAAAAAKAGLQAMVHENKRRLVKMGKDFGMIQPRQGDLMRYWDRHLRTESGLIIW